MPYESYEAEDEARDLRDKLAAAEAKVERLSKGKPAEDPADLVREIHAELDSIPLIVDGQYNPDYRNQVLAVARKAAEAQGRTFEVSGGHGTWRDS